MAQHVPFTDNYDDLSTDRGFQFRFRCERCGNGYLSSFQRNTSGLAADALRAAGNIFGGLLGRAADTAQDMQRVVGGDAHDKALRKAVEEIRPRFNQCQRCGQWVCQDVCWNEARNQCVVCSPKMDQEVAAIESEATVHHLREKALREKNLAKDVKLVSAAAPVKCPKCQAEVPPGKKFCGECGAKVSVQKKCPECGVLAAAGVKFCGECGAKLS